MELIRRPILCSEGPTWQSRAVAYIAAVVGHGICGQPEVRILYLTSAELQGLVERVLTAAPNPLDARAMGELEAQAIKVLPYQATTLSRGLDIAGRLIVYVFAASLSSPVPFLVSAERIPPKCFTTNANGWSELWDLRL